MHATQEHGGPDDSAAALRALSARLDPALSARLVRGGHGLAVGNPAAPVLRAVAVVSGDQYAAELGHGEPPVTLGPVADPDAAAARISRMLAALAAPETTL